MIICVIIIYVTTSESVEATQYLCKFATPDTIECNAQVYNMIKNRKRVACVHETLNPAQNGVTKINPQTTRLQ